jgi:hypothetical protein
MIQNFLVLITFCTFFTNVYTSPLVFNKNTHRHKSKDSSSTTEQNTALLVTNSDTISLMYPKEMGYENDYLHTIFKLNCSTSSSLTMSNLYRVEDSVFDNKTWSIYFILSNLTGGSEIIRLKRISKPSNTSASTTSTVNPTDKDYSYQIASNWLLSIVHKNTTAKILSLDLNVSKRKLYWFEFNKFNHVYSIGIMRLNGHNQNQAATAGSALTPQKINRVLLNINNLQFSQDGYSYIAVVRDNDVFNLNNDITLFISNNETLILCYLINMTCIDYLRYVNPNNQILTTVNVANSNGISEESNDYLYEDEDLVEKTTTAASTTTSQINIMTTVSASEPIVSYGKLMGIKYDSAEKSLIVCDYLNDQIDRIQFADVENFGLDSIETLLKLDYITKLSRQQDNVKLITMNPIMSVLNENSLYWIDYEEGLKVNSFKTPMIRTIYKVKEPISLKLVYVTTPRLSSLSATTVNGASSNKNLVQLLKNINSKYKYPPDYVYYLKYLKELEDEASEEAAALVGGAKNSAFKYNSEKNASSTSGDKSKFVLLAVSVFFSLFLF